MDNQKKIYSIILVYLSSKINIMRNLIIFGLFVIALILVQFAQAQTVDEVITKYTEARGGKDKLLSIKSIYMEGTRQMMGNEILVKVTKEQGKLSRTDFEVAGVNNFFLVTDKEGWNYFAMRMQAPEPLPADRLKQMQTELDIAGPLVDYTAKGYKAELIGKEDVEGTDCYKIKLTLDTSHIISYFIDSKSYLLIRSAQKGGGMGGGRRGGGGGSVDTEVFTDYSDFKPVDGILFAHTLTIKTPSGANAGQGGGTNSSTFDKIELNQPVDPKLYKHQ